MPERSGGVAYGIRGSERRRPPAPHRRPPPADDDGGGPRHFPETECLRGLLPNQTIAAAQDRSARLGIGADRVLVASGALSQDDYARALAQALGAEFEPLDGMPRALCPLDDERLIEAARAGLLPLSLDDALCLVVSPRGTAARRIAALTQQDPTLARRFRFTSDERLTRFILRGAGPALAARATEFLERERPGLSAAPPARFKKIAAAVALLAAIDIAATIWAPLTATFTITLFLAMLFAAWLGLRLVGAFVTAVEHRAYAGRERCRVAGLQRDRRALSRGRFGRRPFARH